MDYNRIINELANGFTKLSLLKREPIVSRALSSVAKVLATGSNIITDTNDRLKRDSYKSSAHTGAAARDQREEEEAEFQKKFRKLELEKLDLEIQLLRRMMSNPDLSDSQKQAASEEFSRILQKMIDLGIPQEVDQAVAEGSAIVPVDDYRILEQAVEWMKRSRPNEVADADFVEPQAPRRTVIEIKEEVVDDTIDIVFEAPQPLAPTSSQASAIAELPELPDYVWLVLKEKQLYSWVSVLERLTQEVELTKKSMFSFRLLLDYTYKETRSLTQYTAVQDLMFAFRDIARLFQYRLRYWRAKKHCMELATKVKQSRRNKLCPYEYVVANVQLIAEQASLSQEHTLEFAFFVWAISNSRQDEVIDRLNQHKQAINDILALSDPEPISLYRQRFLR